LFLGYLKAELDIYLKLSILMWSVWPLIVITKF